MKSKNKLTDVQFLNGKWGNKKGKWNSERKEKDNSKDITKTYIPKNINIYKEDGDKKLMAFIKKEHWGEIPEKYYDVVLECFSDNLNAKIPNPNLEHAKFLTYLLMGKAKKIIKIFSGNLSKELYLDKRIRDVLERAAENKIRVEIIVEEGPETDIKKEYPKLEVEINKLVPTKETKEVPGHFIVIDNEAYRFEKYHDNGNLQSIKGTANFNKPEMAKAMSAVFDKLLIPSTEPIA